MSFLLLFSLVVSITLSTASTHQTHHQRHVRHQRVASEVMSHNGTQRREWEVEHLMPDCPAYCRVSADKIQQVRTEFQDFLEEYDTLMVYFKVKFLNYENYSYSLLEDYPYMRNSYLASEWVWTSGQFGRKLLSLPMDSDVLSLYLLKANKKIIELDLVDSPRLCVTKLSPDCRLHVIRDVLVNNITHVEKHRHSRDFVCHNVIGQVKDVYNNTHAQLLHRCCDSVQFRAGDMYCNVYTDPASEVSGVQVIINIIAIIVTMLSPVVILKLKMICKYDHVTKFFRASLKHGITGQRNYVIRVSSRQLINLNDPKPFSLPRSVFHLVFHCYGEGRCCIHWWGEWSHQPTSCQAQSWCQKMWFTLWRFVAILVVYPIIYYIAILLYAPYLTAYSSLASHAEEHFPQFGPLQLQVNIIALALVPLYNFTHTLWMLFSFLSFLYTVLLLSWPNHPLEKCLLQYEGKRPTEQTTMLYTRLTTAHKGILYRLAYGPEENKRHFFRTPFWTYGIRRTFQFILGILMEIPVFNIFFSLVHFKDLDKDEDDDKEDGSLSCPGRWCVFCCHNLWKCVAWLGFGVLLLGYCTITFLMIEFTLNVMFFVLLAAVLHSSTVLPWLCCPVIISLYLNDSLRTINQEHREVLQLIDANSPRISAVEDSEQVFRGRDVQILKTHNLGAVKFIDGDNTEYVSKELYHDVCADLKCGWSHCVKKVSFRMTVISLFVIFVFMCVSALSTFCGSGVFLTALGILICVLPKVLESYFEGKSRSPQAQRALWAKLMPEILDRHIRVDRTKVADEREQELTTYDVRPVGFLELEMPSVTLLRTLRLWKFAWVVSADQQTQSHESFIIALANKLAAASFLSKVVTRAYSSILEDDSVLRQWCLLVENCILEGSATASSINGIPVESVRLFPRDVQALVTVFDCGTTIDNAVDSINRQLYGPFTKGVLVTIGNTSLAIVNIDHTLFAFNGSCHGDQVTDLFGAVLIATEFNTQNLQSVIKYIVDPYSPDAVPVYSIVPIEGFVFKSPEILEVSVDITN